MGETLYHYCERGRDAGLFAEPLNAITSLAFVLAGLLAWLRADPERSHAILRPLAALAIAIGLGSLAFHTLATRAAKIADVVPILVFMHVYLGFALRVLIGLAWPAVLAVIGLFSLAMVTMGLLPCPRVLEAIVPSVEGRCLNGSPGYLPALVALAVTALVLHRRRHPVARQLGIAAVLFLVSLAFRTLDPAACPHVGPGTHFLWHGLNAVVVWLLLRTAQVCDKIR